MVQADEVPVESDGADTISLVERLRRRKYELATPHSNGLGYVMRERADPLCAEAADEIERLRSQGGAPERSALDELLGACQRYDADPNSTLAIADYLEAKDHAEAVLAAPQPPAPRPPEGGTGWTLMPDEPSEEILDALFGPAPMGKHHPARIACYRAALAAAHFPVQEDRPNAGSDVDGSAGQQAEHRAELDLVFLDGRADQWMADLGVQRMFNAMASVFEKHASQELMDRFRAKLNEVGRQCFVEGGLLAWTEIADQQRRLGTPLPSPPVPGDSSEALPRQDVEGAADDHA